MVATKPPDLNRKYSEQELDFENEPFSKKQYIKMTGV